MQVRHELKAEPDSNTVLRNDRAVLTRATEPPSSRLVRRVPETRFIHRDCLTVRF